jgi:hypothetical protein
VDEYVSPYQHDTRGNRLQRWAVEPGFQHRLLLCTSQRVVDQVRGALHLGRYQVSKAPLRPEELTEWTHCLELDREVDAGMTDFLRLMAEVLVLTVSPAIDSAIALDFYKAPQAGLDPKEWPNTQAGELVHRMKYYANDPAAAEWALGALADRMAAVVKRHPVYREAVIAQVPGHDRDITSWGERLAREVAERTGQELVPARARHSARAESKNREARADLIDEFSLDERVMFRPVLIIDDATGTGDTLKGMAAAARRAKASRIDGLVGARTMRR